MKFTILVTSFLALSLATSCGKLSSSRNNGTASGKTDNLSAKKDLTKLTAAEVVQTRYSKIKYICNYTMDVSKESDGGVLTSSKNNSLVWDIASNTVFTKELKINDKEQNVAFNFTTNLTLSLDTKYNVILNGTEKYNINTYADDGTVLSSITADGTKNPFTLYETQSRSVIETVFGPSNSQLKNKLTMTCKLDTTVNSIYKN
jgi:hypothetical protein